MTRERTSQSLFEETRMSFGEHLEELRVALIRSMLGVGVGCLLGFLAANHVVSFLQGPLDQAIREFRMKRARADYEHRLGFSPPELQRFLEEDGLAPQLVFVDPGQLVEAIRSISPLSLQEIDLTPYLFIPSDITPASVDDMSRLLLDPASAPDLADPMQALHDQLTASQLSVLVALAATTEPDTTHVRQLVSVLNELANNPLVHQSREFDQWLTKPPWSIWHVVSPPVPNTLQQMKARVDEDEDPVLSRRLNRLLIAKTFPKLMDSPEIKLVPMEIWQSITFETQALSPQEGFMIWLKAGLITGLVFSAPWVFYQIWLFVAKGLYPHEQRYIHIYLPLSIILFIFGVCLAFFFVFQPVLSFLFSFNASMGINPQPRIGEWLSFVLFLPLGFGIAFQLPLVMLFLNRVGLVSIHAYIDKWRIAVLVIAILSMVLTPADPVSMILLGAPLTLLYFFGIGLCRWMPTPQSPFGDATDP